MKLAQSPKSAAGTDAESKLAKDKKVPNLVQGDPGPKPMSFELEIQMLRNAHKVLLNRKQETEVMKSDPAKTEAQFINFTTVQDMIGQLAMPIFDKIPAIKKEIGDIRRDLEVLTVHMKETKADIVNFKTRIVELNTFSATLQKFKSVFDVDCNKINNGLEKAHMEMEKLRGQDKTFANEIRKQNERIDIQNTRIHGFKNELQHNFDENERVFQKWFEKVDYENQKIMRTSLDLEERQGKLDKKFDGLDQQVRYKFERNLHEIHS